jgi:hypothetical protein
MKQLVLHIGYPKTGTTTLQRRVFRYLQNSAVPGRDDEVIRPLFRWVSVGPDARVLDAQHVALRSWLSDCLEGTGIISEESILGVHTGLKKRPNRFRYWTPAQNLSAALERLGIDTADVHVVLTIRPQWQWLPASFAEEPSGKSLTRWITQMLELPINSSRNPLNYYRVAESFAELFGRAKIHILPLHLLGTRQYFVELARGTGLNIRIIEAAWSANAGVENRRGTSDMEWEVNPRLTLRGRLGVSLKERPLIRQAVVHRWNLPVRSVSMVEGWCKPTPRARLEPALRERIVKCFGESHRELASVYGAQLVEGDYW